MALGNHRQRRAATATATDVLSLIELPTLYPEQQAIRDHPARFKTICEGRRAGKTFLGVDMLFEGSGERPGAMSGLPLVWFSPTYKMLADVWRDTRRIAHPAIERMSTQEHRIELVGGGIIDMWSLDNPDAARGRKYAGAVIDEAAMITALEEAWQAVIRPTLTDYEGWAVFGSTPRGMNYFKRLWDWGNDPKHPDWASWQLPTTVNPYIRPSEVEAARLDLTDRRFRQEYLAEFLEDAGGVFRSVRERSCLQRVEPYPGTFTMGMDFGRTTDYTVLSVVDAATGNEVDMIRFHDDSFELQMSRIQAVMERWNPTVVFAEFNSFGGPMVQRLQQEYGPRVQAFTTLNATKKAVVENLVLMSEQDQAHWLDDEEGIAEMQAFEETVLPSGMIRYAAPEGMHDDIVIARCLAYWGIRPGRRRVEVT